MEKMNYEEIAIIGMAARFSHADNIDELWDNLRVGKDCVTDCPEGRKKDIEDYLKYLNLDKKDIVYRKAAYLKEIDKFDFEFFRIPPVSFLISALISVVLRSQYSYRLPAGSRFLLHC